METPREYQRDFGEVEGPIPIEPLRPAPVPLELRRDLASPPRPVSEGEGEDLVDMSEEDKEFLFGTGEDDPFVSGEGATDIVDMTDADREFLLGTGEKPKPKSSRYVVGTRRAGGGRDRVGGGGNADNFLSGIQ